MTVTTREILSPEERAHILRQRIANLRDGAGEYRTKGKRDLAIIEAETHLIIALMEQYL